MLSQPRKPPPTKRTKVVDATETLRSIAKQLMRFRSQTTPRALQRPYPKQSTVCLSRSYPTRNRPIRLVGRGSLNPSQEIRLEIVPQRRFVECSIYSVSQLFSGLEMRYIFGNQANGFACFRISTNARGAIMQRKTPEAANFNSRSSRKRRRHVF